MRGPERQARGRRCSGRTVALAGPHQAPSRRPPAGQPPWWRPVWSRIHRSRTGQDGHVRVGMRGGATKRVQPGISVRLDALLDYWRHEAEGMQKGPTPSCWEPGLRPSWLRWRADGRRLAGAAQLRVRLEEGSAVLGKRPFGLTPPNMTNAMSEARAEASFNGTFGSGIGRHLPPRMSRSGVSERHPGPSGRAAAAWPVVGLPDVRVPVVFMAQQPASDSAWVALPVSPPAY